ncbi:MAG: hypothetical protein QW680_13625, partial [Pyrobaculum sp.]
MLRLGVKIEGYVLLRMSSASPSVYDLIILLLESAGGRLSKSKIQRGLHILSRLSEALEFKPYRYGPWSPQLGDEINRLVTMGAVRVEKTKWSSPTARRR